MITGSSRSDFTGHGASKKTDGRERPKPDVLRKWSRGQPHTGKNTPSSGRKHPKRTMRLTGQSWKPKKDPARTGMPCSRASRSSAKKPRNLISHRDSANARAPCRNQKTWGIRISSLGRRGIFTRKETLQKAKMTICFITVRSPVQTVAHASDLV